MAGAAERVGADEKLIGAAAALSAHARVLTSRLGLRFIAFVAGPASRSAAAFGWSDSPEGASEVRLGAEDDEDLYRALGWSQRLGAQVCRAYAGAWPAAVGPSSIRVITDGTGVSVAPAGSHEAAAEIVIPFGSAGPFRRRI
jgi:hypothetical protein